MKKGMKKAAAAALVLGMVSLGAASNAQADWKNLSASALKKYTASYNSYAKTADSYIKQVTQVKSRSAARSLYNKIEQLEKKLNQIEDRVDDYNNGKSLDRKIEALEKKLDNSQDRLEKKWNLDDDDNDRYDNNDRDDRYDD